MQSRSLSRFHLFLRFYKPVVCLLLITGIHRANGQLCTESYFKVTYNTSTVQNPVSSTLLPGKQIMVAGSVLRKNSVLLDGWLLKLSPQGTILWSRHYTSPIYNYIKFNKAIPDRDNGFLVTGNIGNVDTTKVPPAPYTQLGLLIKVDKYGNLLWSRVFGKVYVTNLSTDIENILALPDGDFVLGINYSGQNSSNILLRIDPNGNIKWTTTISSMDPPVRPSKMFLKQMKNGQLVCANYAWAGDVTSPFIISQQGYYAVCIDEASGLRIWDRFYKHNAFSGREKVFADVVSIMELPNGDISYIASYADTGHIYFHRTTKVINLIADDIGRLKKVIKYQNELPPLFAAASAETGNGGRVILMDNTDAPLMMHINASGDVDWQHAYPRTGRSQETRSVLSTDEGYYFFSFTHNGGSTDLSLVKTDIEGNASCVQGPFSIHTADITNDFSSTTLKMTIDQTAARWYNIIALSMNDYDLSAETMCRKTCCEDKITTEQKVDLCNVTSYKLPNGDVVTAAGTYSIVHKTPKGCDSIVYYHVQFSQPPVVNLGDNTCFNGADSIILKVTSGYANYLWSGGNMNGPTLTVRTTGDYWVSVTNGCGTKTDTITVFDKCEFEMYIPSAFTPNGDRVNDVFKVPPQNKNKLVKLMIFNRYGQMIFETSDPLKGWDGTYNQKLQDAGTYVYTMVMETLNGKRITKNGTVALIR